MRPRRFVAVGGDGTVNEVLNGLIDPSGCRVEPGAVLCPIPAGTANELCRALGHLQQAQRAYDAAASGATRAIDLLRVRCTRPIFTAMVANTENGGGGMRLMPGAKFDDGLLDLIEMGDIGPLAMLTTVLPKVYSGAHVHHPKVRVSRGTFFSFDSAVETLVDLDGETVGRLPLEVSVTPQSFAIA
jgi:diacylglycerol kinase family enzyme